MFNYFATYCYKLVGLFNKNVLSTEHKRIDGQHCEYLPSVGFLRRMRRMLLNGLTQITLLRSLNNSSARPAALSKNGLQYRKITSKMFVMKWKHARYQQKYHRKHDGMYWYLSTGSHEYRLVKYTLHIDCMDPIRWFSKKGDMHEHTWIARTMLNAATAGNDG